MQTFLVFFVITQAEQVVSFLTAGYLRHWAHEHSALGILAGCIPICLFAFLMDRFFPQVCDERRWPDADRKVAAAMRLRLIHLPIIKVELLYLAALLLLVFLPIFEHAAGVSASSPFCFAPPVLSPIQERALTGCNNFVLWLGWFLVDLRSTPGNKTDARSKDRASIAGF